MKKILISVLLLISFIGFSQIDSGKKKVRISIDLPDQNITPTPKITEPEIENKIQYKSVLDNENDYLKRYSITKKTAPSKSILDNSTDFKNPGDEIAAKMNQEFSQAGNFEDVFFGKYRVYTPIIKILTRDFAEPDGDKVQIILNDYIVVKSINLTLSFKTNYIDLREGDNLLNILALNQGLAGPNTATFAIYDGNDNLLTSNNWSLLTGVSAKFIIEYVKPLEEKK